MAHRYSGRSDCGCIYEMTTCLLNESHEVIEEFKPEPVTLDPDCDDCSWKKVHRQNHVLSKYMCTRSGTQRYGRPEHTSNQSSSPLLNPRSPIRFLATAPECVSSCLNMEDKTPSSGMVGLESGSPGAVLLSTSDQEGEDRFALCKYISNVLLLSTLNIDFL